MIPTESEQFQNSLLKPSLQCVPYLAGVHLTTLGGHLLSPWLSTPATVLWLVLCANSLNLIDGLDGLACGIGLFATATALLAAGVQHNISLAYAVIPLFGALLGFLRYNFNPARIFLGDSGSLFVGFLLGCFGLLWTEKSATLLGLTAPLMVFAIPLLDTTLAIVRRFLHNKPIFSADRGHIHHRLLARGLAPQKVVLLLYACCAVGALCSVAVMNSHTSEAASDCLRPAHLVRSKPPEVRRVRDRRALPPSPQF